MDESYLTGEPYQVSKAPGTTVLSGSVNGESALTIKCEQLAIDSRYSKIMKVMRDSEQHKPRIRRLGDQLGAWYTPLALILAISTWVITGDSIRFLSVLVVATPCPLLIAIPVAIISSISLAARFGIIIKDPAILEKISTCSVAIFDKTGTLTYGKPKLTEIILTNNISSIESRNEMLILAASVEMYSKHPLSSSILEEAKKQKLILKEAKEVRIIFLFNAIAVLIISL
jgi:P-type E1-E2 ATPase